MKFKKVNCLLNSLLRSNNTPRLFDVKSCFELLRYKYSIQAYTQYGLWRFKIKTFGKEILFSICFTWFRFMCETGNTAWRKRLNRCTFLSRDVLGPFTQTIWKGKSEDYIISPKLQHKTSFCCALQELNSSFEAEVSAGYSPGRDGGHCLRKLNPAFLRLDRADIQPSRKNLFLAQTLLMCLCPGTTVVPLEARTAFLPD